MGRSIFFHAFVGHLLSCTPVLLYCALGKADTWLIFNSHVGTVLPPSGLPYSCLWRSRDQASIDFILALGLYNCQFIHAPSYIPSIIFHSNVSLLSSAGLDAKFTFTYCFNIHY